MVTMVASASGPDLGYLLRLGDRQTSFDSAERVNVLASEASMMPPAKASPKEPAAEFTPAASSPSGAVAERPGSLVVGVWITTPRGRE
jgi:hypothetical protein